MTVPVDHDQQGLPVRPRRDRAGRPADPRRRVRHRRRRRHGVDDQRAAPAAEVARGLQVRRRSTMLDSMAYDGLTDAVRPTCRWASRPSGTTRGSALTREEQDAFAARVAPAAAAAQKNGVFDDEIVAGAHPAAQGRPARGQRGRGRPRRHHGRVARPSCGRRSARTARSPPARRRRSPTAPPPSS